MRSKKTIIAVFDFDHTLTTKDSLFVFLESAVGRSKMVLGFLLLSPMLICYKLGFISNGDAKQKLISYFIKGWSKEKINLVSQKCANTQLKKILRSQAFERFQWHKKQGHKLVLISASLESYLVPFARSMKFDHVCGTKLEIKTGIVTGKFLGKNCYGQEKVQRLQELLGDFSDYIIYAYGDSKGDLPLLSIVDYPYYKKF
jgi:HAD superfamily hydrolase (TIGR01490 family)